MTFNDVNHKILKIRFVNTDHLEWKKQRITQFWFFLVGHLNPRDTIFIVLALLLKESINYYKWSLRPRTRKI